jgi:hypothetical protein
MEQKSWGSLDQSDLSTPAETSSLFRSTLPPPFEDTCARLSATPCPWWSHGGHDLGSVADALYTLIFFIRGKRSVRFVQSPPSNTLLHDLTTLVDSGSGGPVLDSVDSAEQIAQAQQSLEDRGGFGKRSWI